MRVNSLLRSRDQENPMKFKAIVAIFPLIVSLNAFAACRKGSETIFSCITGKGKVIEVCDSKKTIDYSFGTPTEKPEIVVSVLRTIASTTQWAGIGRWRTYSIEIPNGNTVYSIYWSADSLAQKNAIEAGVNVEIDQKNAATIKCVGENKIVQHLEGMDLKPTDLAPIQ